MENYTSQFSNAHFLYRALCAEEVAHRACGGVEDLRSHHGSVFSHQETDEVRYPPSEILRTNMYIKILTCVFLTGN